MFLADNRSVFNQEIKYVVGRYNLYPLQWESLRKDSKGNQQLVSNAMKNEVAEDYLALIEATESENNIDAYCTVESHTSGYRILVKLHQLQDINYAENLGQSVTHLLNQTYQPLGSQWVLMNNVDKNFEIGFRVTYTQLVDDFTFLKQEPDYKLIGNELITRLNEKAKNIGAFNALFNDANNIAPVLESQRYKFYTDIHIENIRFLHALFILMKYDNKVMEAVGQGAAIGLLKEYGVPPEISKCVASFFNRKDGVRLALVNKTVCNTAIAAVSRSRDDFKDELCEDISCLQSASNDKR